MSDIFQPQVAELNSSATAQAGVTNTGGVELFSDVAGAAINAGFAADTQSRAKSLESDLDGIVGERKDDLANLRKGLTNISQAMGTVTNSSMLQVKARALVDKTRAESPWAADKAEEVYKRVIGSGKSGSTAGGVFTKSPEEEAVEKVNASVVEKQVMFGMSRQNAEDRVRLDAQQAAQKKEYEFMSARGKIEGDAVNGYVNSQLTHSTVELMDKLDLARQAGNGSIDAEDIPVIKRQLNKKAALMLQDALGGLRDAEGNAVTNPPDKATVDAIQKDIDDWLEKSNAMVDNSSTTKMISDLNLESTAREQEIIHRNFGVIDILNAKGGQAYVADYLKVVGNKPGAIKTYFEMRSPQVMQILGKNADVAGLLDRGYNKLIDAKETGAGDLAVADDFTRVNPFITEEEALVAGTALVDMSIPASLLHAVFDTTVEEVEAKENFKKMLEKNKDAMAMFYGEKYSNYLVAKPKEAIEISNVAIEAARASYNTLSFSNTGSFNAVDFTIKEVGGQYTSKIVAVGADVSSEMAAVLSDTYKMFKYNPTVLKSFLSEQGLPAETTPAQATKVAIMGKAAPVEQPKAPEPQVDTSAPALPEDTSEAQYDALRDASQEEIASFQSALRGAKSPQEKAAVHAAFIDGEFRSAV